MARSGDFGLFSNSPALEENWPNQRQSGGTEMISCFGSKTSEGYQKRTFCEKNYSRHHNEKASCILSKTILWPQRNALLLRRGQKEIIN